VVFFFLINGEQEKKVHSNLKLYDIIIFSFEQVLQISFFVRFFRKHPAPAKYNNWRIIYPKSGTGFQTDKIE